MTAALARNGRHGLTVLDVPALKQSPMRVDVGRVDDLVPVTGRVAPERAFCEVGLNSNGATIFSRLREWTFQIDSARSGRMGVTMEDGTCQFRCSCRAREDLVLFPHLRCDTHAVRVVAA